MKTSALLAVVLTAGVIASAGSVLLGVPSDPERDVGPASGDPGVPVAEDGPPDGWQDPPEIAVSWQRSGADVIVTFTQVDEPKLLDCAWWAHVTDLTGADGAYIAWGNFTDREAWKESSRYSWCMDSDWPSDPPWPEPWNGEGMDLTDADGDHRLSAGDYLAIHDIAPGEVDLKLGIAFWGSWYYEFRWRGAPDGESVI